MEIIIKKYQKGSPHKRLEKINEERLSKKRPTLGLVDLCEYELAISRKNESFKKMYADWLKKR